MGLPENGIGWNACMVLCEAEIEDEKGNYTVQSTLVRLPCSLELLIRHRTIFFFHNKKIASVSLSVKKTSATLLS
jgi:hypothetical protein